VSRSWFLIIESPDRRLTIFWPSFPPSSKISLPSLSGSAACLLLSPFPQISFRPVLLETQTGLQPRGRSVHFCAGRVEPADGIIHHLNCILSRYVFTRPLRCDLRGWVMSRDLHKLTIYLSHQLRCENSTLYTGYLSTKNISPMTDI